MSLLETEKRLELPAEFYYRSAQVARKTHRPVRAVQMVTRYLELAGRDGEYYMDALELLNAAEGETFDSAKTCQGKPEGSECWMELDNQPGCHVWNPTLQPDATVTWTGECAESLARGTGTRKWVWDGGKKTSEGTVRLESGKPHGKWKVRYSNGHVHEGPYEQGKRHGKWVIQWADNNGDLTGNRMEGPYVEGKMQGLWTARWTHGSVEETPYVDGQIHGQLTGRDADGDTWEYEYVEDKKHGQYTGRTAEGKVRSQGPFVDGEKHGAWTETDFVGVWKGTYVRGKKHGRWVARYEDGRIDQEGSFKEGKRHGEWVDYLGDGRTVYRKGPYVEGKQHGRWIETDGIEELEGENVQRMGEGQYVEGKRDGTWVFYPEGYKENSAFANTLVYDNGSVAPIPLEPEMVFIPAGQYRRGCRLDCEEYGSSTLWQYWKPVQKVKVESFMLSKYEVTFAEYDRFTAATERKRVGDGGWGWGRGRRPVIYVSWEDAVAYTRWLSERTGKQYRLPSEAEWEYAARSGTDKKKYSWGNDVGHNRANCGGCGSRWQGRQTAPVGSFGANSWGLHDMHGNVWEWVQDCWNDNYNGSPKDGSAWESGDCSKRVFRGGSWYSPSIREVTARSAYRNRSATTLRDDAIGFRVARTSTP